MAITIAIPFYNAEKYLADSIRSVFAQTYQNWELILIDDGSTDKSLEIAQSVKDLRVRVISDGKNKKLATRLNEVTKLAKYDYIARMDADDLMSPDRIAKQIAVLKGNPNVDLVSCGTYSILNNGTLIGKRGMAYNERIFPDDLLFGRVFILHAGILARKSWYLRNEYNEQLKLGQDTYMWIETSYKNDLNISLLSEPLYVYREEGNVSKSKLLRAYNNERDFLAPFISKTNVRIKYVLKSYLKTLFVTLFGANKHLLHRRNEKITSSDIVAYESICNAISNTKI